MKKARWLLLVPIAVAIVLSLRQDPTPTPQVVEESVQPVKSTPSAPLTPAPKAEVAISVLPAKVLQGDPVEVVITNEAPNDKSQITSITFNGTKLKPFVENGETKALIGLDLRMKPGTYPIVATLSDGKSIKKDLVVGGRVLVQAPLGIPDKLGGNTATSEQELLNTLAKEGEIINAIPTSADKLWSGAFRYPLNTEITITDVYGYSRLTGASSIAHKGTDFRASIGTDVVAINSGKVAYVGYLRNYGNVIAVDHGAGVLSIYMHLSKVEKALGDKVEKGERIALSGDTGYVLGPHLHLTIRINNISIDPMKFLALLGKT
ncbi:M23 family metallopeptidase [Candidatus Parcubacteria bacterium]|nr:M23 family metallopeptidase [Candidatus Parcubacteria bacterium]